MVVAGRFAVFGDSSLRRHIRIYGRKTLSYRKIVDRFCLRDTHIFIFGAGFIERLDKMLFSAFAAVHNPNRKSLRHIDENILSINCYFCRYFDLKHGKKFFVDHRIIFYPDDKSLCHSR